MQRLLATISVVVWTLRHCGSTRSPVSSGGRWSGCKPKHVHMAGGPDGPSTSMTISFATPFNCGSSVIVAVFYGKGDKASSPFEHVTLPSNRMPEQYNRTRSYDYEGYVSDYFHHIIIRDLTPATKYRYECVLISSDDNVSNLAIPQKQRVLRDSSSPSHALQSTDFSFFSTSPPLGKFPATTSHPLKFAIVGDLGQTIHSAHTIQHMMNVPNLAAIMHAGDLSYADCDERRWDQWFSLIEPLARTVPWHVCPGNHEIEVEHGSGEVFQSYEKRFRMPWDRPAELKFDRPGIEFSCCPSVHMSQYDYGNSFHAVQFGPVRFLLLNSYTSTLPGSKQHDWFVHELHTINRDLTPWIIVVMHCPFYNTFKVHQHEKQEEQMKLVIEPLLIRYEVNIVIAGHVHAYARTKNVAHGVLEPKAPKYIVIGDGGNREGHVKSFAKPDPESWIEVRNLNVFGFGLLEVCNKTHAKWNWVKNVDESRIEVHDHAYIVNQHFT